MSNIITGADISLNGLLYDNYSMYTTMDYSIPFDKVYILQSSNAVVSDRVYISENSASNFMKRSFIASLTEPFRSNLRTLDNSILPDDSVVLILNVRKLRRLRLVLNVLTKSTDSLDKYVFNESFSNYLKTYKGFPNNITRAFLSYVINLDDGLKITRSTLSPYMNVEGIKDIVYSESSIANDFVINKPTIDYDTIILEHVDSYNKNIFGITNLIDDKDDGYYVRQCYNNEIGKWRTILKTSYCNYIPLFIDGIFSQLYAVCGHAYYSCVCCDGNVTYRIGICDDPDVLYLFEQHNPDPIFKLTCFGVDPYNITAESITYNDDGSATFNSISCSIAESRPLR